MKHNTVIQLRIDRDTKALWEKAAKLEGISLSEFIRRTLDTHVERHREPANPTQPAV